ncbi:transcriptional regulator [Ralstonia mannitolilytica]|uniref:transcriptional regulator n=1 Tax=Ralstonia mannitolilytica TaxID=105219 RepID=UPI00292FB0A0|nr:YdaS family helix-turn-helix protein [Ralstonia mannitolilytica]
MDKLKTFLRAIPADERQAFAIRCGTTWAFLRNVMYGQRTPNEKLCVALERESRRVVTRRDLRPDDWVEIWPELSQAEPLPRATTMAQGNAHIDASLNPSECARGAA